MTRLLLILAIFIAAPASASEPDPCQAQMDEQRHACLERETSPAQARACQHAGDALFYCRKRHDHRRFVLVAMAEIVPLKDKPHAPPPPPKEEPRKPAPPPPEPPDCNRTSSCRCDDPAWDHYSPCDPNPR